MQTDPLAEVPVLVKDMEGLLNTLRLAKDVFVADDLARSGRLMVASSYTPLTKDVAAAENRVEGILKDFYASQYVATLDGDDDEEDDVEAAEEAHHELLKANPLGTGTARRPAPAFKLTDDPEDDGSTEDEPDA